MTDYRPPLRDMQFLLNDVFAVPELFASMPDTQEVSADLISAILDEAGKIAAEQLAPVNQNGDREGCRFADGEVTAPAGFKQAYEAFASGGWSGLTGNPEFGGQGMPKLLSAMIEEMQFAANTSFTLYTVLTTGASLTLNSHGSQALKERYLPKLYSGQWSGTMCLTEAHAGTDLGMIKSRAEPASDGSYSITGSKIFITSGEHDLTENIIHLVLAKLPDAPAGPRGISLFLVPKFLVDDSGEITATRNKVSCGSIEEKMGIHGSATCVMNFDGAEGYLVGAANGGLATMFTMMNYERLSMGVQGNGLAEASYQTARDYALERLQGRAPAGASRPELAADPLIVHPDVRRMLLTMRANIVAGRALSIFAASQLDISRFHPDAAARAKADKLVALLIPVQKAYCSDRGFDACVLAQQVLGGHGYVAEWGLEQNIRDARIAQIYEGANGIQALDLMGRKTVRVKGEYLQLLMGDIADWLAAHQDDNKLQAAIEKFSSCRQHLADCTEQVIGKAENNAAEVGAASYPYLELLGLTLYGYMWLRIMAACHEQINSEQGAADYHDGLLKTGEYFMARLLPAASSLREEIAAGADSLMAIRAEQF